MLTIWVLSSRALQRPRRTEDRPDEVSKLKKPALAASDDAAARCADIYKHGPDEIRDAARGQIASKKRHHCVSVQVSVGSSSQAVAVSIGTMRRSHRCHGVTFDSLERTAAQVLPAPPSVLRPGRTPFRAGIPQRLVELWHERKAYR